MAISDNYVPLRQLGNGSTTQFSGTWAMLKSTYARVYLENATTGVQTQQTLGVDYTISITSTGFTVTMLTAPTNAYYVVIGRETDRTQTTPYKTSTGFQGSVEEDSFDKLTAMIQELKNGGARSIQAPLGDTSSLILPTATLRANSFPYFDASGNIITMSGITSIPVSAAMSPVVQALTLAAARSAMGAASSGANSDITSLSGLTSINGGGLFGFRNRLINGDMQIDQRYEGAATTNLINGYTVDRWALFQTTTGKLIGKQNQNGYTLLGTVSSYYGVTSQSSYSALATDYYGFAQVIEANNIKDFHFGMSDAKTVVLSFRVRSSLTGVFSGSLVNAALNRSYPFTYTVNSANTWEDKSVVIKGDTSGTWNLSGNSEGVKVWFDLGSGSNYRSSANSWQSGNFAGVTGSVSIVGTSGATWAVTACQLEAATTASPFEIRDFQSELSRCQRYYAKSFDNGVAPGTASVVGHVLYDQNYLTTAIGLTSGGSVRFPVTMRGTPTVNLYSTATGASGKIRDQQNSLDVSASASNISSGSFCWQVSGSVSTSRVTWSFHFTAEAEF